MSELVARQYRMHGHLDGFPPGGAGGAKDGWVTS